MENALLALHLILSLVLVGIVLLQRSEGGGLGMGTGSGGVVTGRAAATALGKLTWGIAAAFIVTSIALTVVAGQNSSSSSVIDQIGGTVAPVETAPATTDTTAPATNDLGAVPSADAPATPPKAKN